MCGKLRVVRLPLKSSGTERMESVCKHPSVDSLAVNKFLSNIKGAWDLTPKRIDFSTGADCSVRRITHDSYESLFTKDTGNA